MSRLPSFLALAIILSACNKKSTTSSSAEDAASPKEPSAVASEPAAASTSQKEKPALTAEIGKPAPDFTLKSHEGESFSLADQRGKVVVLEWFNPDCPYVRASHTEGSLIDAAARFSKDGIVYVAINSAGQGKQGFGPEANQAGKERFKLDHPILLDESGKVGRSYGATNTPQAFVINAEGTLVYAGAVDNAPDGAGEDPEGGEWVRYLDLAVEQTLKGQPVAHPKTKAWGCSVKYSGKI